jgi:hypothetical protein
MKRILLVGALAVWALPAAAQHSRVWECLQRAPAGLSAATMLAECRLEVRDWMTTCEQTRNADVCRQAVAEEANVAAAYKRVQQP